MRSIPLIPMGFASAIADVQRTLTIDDIDDIDDADAGVLQPPVPLTPPVPRETDVISDVFNATRDAIAELEAARLAPMTSRDWSPAQHVRAA